MPDDAALIQQFVSTRSQDAFAEIYRRHAPWIFAVARRQVKDAELANDITQAVFIVLSEKAARINPTASLAGWLFTTTRLTAKAALRAQERRRRHERKAAMIKQTITTNTDLEILDDLDNVVVKLRPADQQAI